jgi:hypothetical protein
VAANIRIRFWVEAGLAALSGFLGILTLFTRDWIEALTGFDPDNHNGSFEWMIVAMLLRLHSVFHCRPRRLAPPEVIGAHGKLTAASTAETRRIARFPDCLGCIHRGDRSWAAEVPIQLAVAIARPNTKVSVRGAPHLLAFAGRPAPESTHRPVSALPLDTPIQSDVWFGSKSDLGRRPPDVRFHSESRPDLSEPARLQSANSGSDRPLFW